MRRYVVMPAEGRVPLCGAVAGTPWQAARRAAIDRYPWYTGGDKQATWVRVLYDARNLYVQFRCRDRHISAVETRLNGDVYLDSCVELFAGPDAEYFNLEINCCGVMHLGWGAGRHGRRLIGPALARRVGIAASVASDTKAESCADRGWWVAARLPFAVLSQFAGRPVRARPGSLWRANFYRCGGQTDPQYACWNRIDWPQPDFHRPEFFARLRFM